LAVPEPTDKAPSLVTGYARSCLLDLRHAGQPRAETALASEGGWTVLVMAFPSPAGQDVPDLTECDRDCLRLLGQLRQPMSAVRIRKEMDVRGIGIYGVATVKRSLARLYLRLRPGLPALSHTKQAASARGRPDLGPALGAGRARPDRLKGRFLKEKGH
jgi:hypothetical protein